MLTVRTEIDTRSVAPPSSCQTHRAKAPMSSMATYLGSARRKLVCRKIIAASLSPGMHSIEAEVLVVLRDSRVHDAVMMANVTLGCCVEAAAAYADQPDTPKVRPSSLFYRIG